MKLLADAIPLGKLKGLGPLGDIASSDQAFAKFTNAFSVGLSILTISGGIWFIIQIGAGAFQWIASAGEKDALSKAQKRISNAIFGLFVIIFAYALISIVGQIFGFDILSPYKSLFGIGGSIDPNGPGACPKGATWC